MAAIKTKIGRRAFIKNTSLASGGLVLGFSILNSCKPDQAKEMAVIEMPKEWFEINAYLKIGDNGLVTIMAPNPEFGQGVITSMPMIVADELGVDWNNVLVEQANYDTKEYGSQFTGGSQGIRRGWEGLRMAGASAKHMLKQAASQTWQVPLGEIVVANGVLSHEATQKSADFGEMASLAATFEVPEEIALKEVGDFTIIGNSKKGVDTHKIVTGKPLFGLDYQQEGALTAMVIHPPAFGMQLQSFDASEAEQMPGVQKVFQIKTWEDNVPRGYFDTNAFTDLIALVGTSTWELMNAKKKVSAQWEPIKNSTHKMNRFGSEIEVEVPSGLESTEKHYSQMNALDAKPGAVSRKDGNPEAIFNASEKTIERSYSCPFLAHNCMEPMNFFADVTSDNVKLAGPVQAPSLVQGSVATRLVLPPENIHIELTRMGGGFGRRAYGHYAIEAALISKEVNAPVKLVYTREDDMTFGIYRPSYMATYKAALDENNNLAAFHVKAGGVPETPLFANRFPAGAVKNYKAEQWALNSNITIGAFRAPRSNFMAGAEQSFLDEVAELAGKDPIEFRLALLEQAKNNPVGERNDYDADRLAGVLKLVRDKSNWGQTEAGVHRGVSAYFCHNSYAAHVLDIVLEDGTPKVKNVVCAIDCGIVINPDAASNMAEGAIIDGIGNAMYGELSFKDGATQQQNFDKYRIVRMKEVPENIEVHFVKNDIDPTGLGEPPFPPIFGALANALYKATGRRHYRQPFITDKPPLVG